MKNEKEWIDHLRNRMEGYSEPLPKGLWDTLSKELEVQKAPKVIPIWRRWQVAASVLVLLASALTYWFWSSPKADFQNQKLAVVVEDTPLPENAPKELREQMADAKETEVYQSRPSVLPSSARLMEVVVSDTLHEEEADLPLEAVPSEVNQPKDEPEEKPGQAEEKVQEEQVHTRQLQAQRAADRKQMERNAMSVKNKTGKSSGLSIGVGAGNTPYSSLNTFDGMGSFVSRSTYYTVSDAPMSPVDNGGLAYSQVLLENAVQTPQTRVKHRMPVTVGFSVAWHFHKDWALETGLNYTLLSSDIHSGSKSYVEENQKLHYVGIPVKLHRSIWKNSWLSIYASAGGEVEKCVSGRLETVTVTNGGVRSSEQTSLDINPLQWSIAAAAGAQVNFTPRLGVYVEPGIAYYFDDHSKVETIRKEHPLNFNLQLGLRVNVSK